MATSTERRDKGKSPEPERTWRTALHDAAEENDHDRLLDLRGEPGFRDLLDAQDEGGRTALLIACQRGYANIVVLLLEESANVLIPARGGYTCLHEAAFMGNHLVVNLLLGGIVEISSPQLGSKTIVPPNLSDRKKLVEEQTDEDKFTALHLASIVGYKDVVISIFESYLDIVFELNDPHVPRPDLDLDDIDRVSWRRFQTRTRLPELIKFRNAATPPTSASFSSFQNHVPNAHQRKESGVKWAKDAGYHKRLVDARLDLAIYVNTHDCLGRTALHYAAWKNKVSVISDLISAGANVNATDACDFTPLHFASRNGNSQMVSKLIELSTDIENVYLLEGNVAAKSNVATMKLIELGSSSPASSSSVPCTQGKDGYRPRVSDFIFLEDRDGVTPLRYAAEGYGYVEWIKQADIGYCELNYVGVVKSLLEIIDAKEYGLFSPSFDGETLWTVVFPRLESKYKFLRRNRLQRLFNGAGRVHNLGKELMRKAVELAKNKSDMDLFLSIQAQLLWTLEEVLETNLIHKKLVTGNFGFDEQTGLTLFHFAAFAGLGTEMRGLLSVPELAECLNQCWERTNQTPLHVAVIEGNEDVVKALVQDDRVRVIEEDCKKRTPLQIAVEKSREEDFSDSWKNIEKLLLKRGEVQRFIEKLYKDRQVYVDAANAILVGAALIASVTFAGWLQPPLGYKDYFEILFSDSSTPQSFIGVRQYASVRAFFIFNSLSFFFAIATVISGAGAVLPAFSFFIKDEVDLVRKWLMLTSVLLVFSIAFVVGAFAAAGMAALPPIPKYRAYMIVTAAIGLSVCLVILITFFYRLYVIHPYKWLTRWSSYARERLQRGSRDSRRRASADSNSTTPTAWIDRKYYHLVPDVRQ